VAGEGDQQHRHDGDQRDRGEHLPAAVAIGERTIRDPANGADQDRGGDQQGRLRAGQRHRLGVRRGQRADEVPGPEADRESPGGKGEIRALAAELAISGSRCLAGHRRGHDATDGAGSN